MDEHWYRNRDWSPSISADFEKKLARTRSQKAQYLRIQGSILKETHPRQAIALLERCVAEGDATSKAHALAEMAQAYCRLGDPHAALRAMEAAMEQERLEPAFRTNAPFDYAFLVALTGDSDRYDRAVAVLEEQGEGFLPAMRFEEAVARALIADERGETEAAAVAARHALRLQGEAGPIPGFPEIGAVPEGEHPLLTRLRGIAAA